MSEVNKVITENPSEMERSSKAGRQSSIMHQHSEVTQPQMNSARINKEAPEEMAYEEDFENNLQVGQTFAPENAKGEGNQAEINQAPTFAGRISSPLPNNEEDEVRAG